MRGTNLRILSSREGKLPLIVVIILAVVVVGGVGVVAFKKLGSKGGGKDKKVEKVELTPWKMDEFVANLADKEESRYLKVTMILEVEKKSKEKGGGGHGEGEGEVSIEDSKARDAIIEVLTTKCYGDLLSESGKTKLKEELKAKLNGCLEENKVESIYFTSFAMQ
jgi:flagellar basal body-associated protein FliL